MKIFIGADHNGFDLKKEIIEYLTAAGHEVVDEGDQQKDPGDDFPVFAARVVAAMLGSTEADPKGILICGSGQGMVMAANRFKGIRASLVWDVEEARSARNDDDSNVLCLPAREQVNFATTGDIITTWLETPFAGAERFVRRIKQLDELN